MALGYAHLDLGDFLDPAEQARMRGGGAVSATVALSAAPPHLVPIDVDVEDPGRRGPPAGDVDAEVAAIAGGGGGMTLTISVQWNQL